MSGFDKFIGDWRAWYGSHPPSFHHFLVCEDLPAFRICKLPRCEWFDATPRQCKTAHRRLIRLGNEVFGPDCEFVVVSNRSDKQDPITFPGVKLHHTPALDWCATVWTYADHQQWRMEGNPLYCNSGHTANVMTALGSSRWSTENCARISEYLDRWCRWDQDILFVNPTNGVCFGEYEHGYYVFAPKSEALNSIRRKFRAWEYDDKDFSST